MPINNIEELAAATLDGSQMILVLIKPEPEKVELTGVIDGTNATFVFPVTHYPIAPTTGKTIKPTAADVKIYTKKGTAFSEALIVTSVNTIEDPTTGYTVYASVTLAAPPTVLGADSVWGICSVEHDLYVQQSIKPKVDQKANDIEQMGSKKVFSKYGKIATSYDVDVILADLAAVILGNYDESSETGVETGYTLYELRDNPLLMAGYVPIYSGDEETDPADKKVLGRVILRSVTKEPGLPEGKANANLTLGITLNVGQKPRILVKDAA